MEKGGGSSIKHEWGLLVSQKNNLGRESVRDIIFLQIEVTLQKIIGFPGLGCVRTIFPVYLVYAVSYTPWPLSRPVQRRQTLPHKGHYEAVLGSELQRPPACFCGP